MGESALYINELFDLLNNIGMYIILSFYFFSRGSVRLIETDRCLIIVMFKLAYLISLGEKFGKKLLSLRNCLDVSGDIIL